MRRGTPTARSALSIMNLSHAEERLIRLFRGLDDTARHRHMVALARESMEQYAVNMGVALCESDRIAQRHAELGDAMRRRYHERLWAAHPPLLLDGQEVADTLAPLVSTLPLLDIILGYPWDTNDEEMAEFLADSLCTDPAPRAVVERVHHWLNAWREGVLASMELQQSE